VAAAEYDAAKRSLEACHSGAAPILDLLEAATRAKAFYQAAQRLNEAAFRLRHHQTVHGILDPPASPSLPARPSF
jgi:hypothetical protein